MGVHTFNTAYLQERYKKLDSVHDDVAPLVEARMGRFPFRSRFHRLPRRLEQDYEVTEEVLGQGVNGRVVLAHSRVTSSPKKDGHATRSFAVKSLSFKNVTSAKQAEYLNEVHVSLCVDHPHIAKMHDIYEADGKLHLVMECLAGGELYARVAKEKRLPAQEAAAYVRQMLLVLAYLHRSRGVAHRDVKLENFLFDRPGGSHLKLIDFSLSAFDGGARMSAPCGTIHYVAPEVLKADYTPQCDTWSLGVIAFILLSGKMPFRGPAMREGILQGACAMPSEQWAEIPLDAKDFVRALLCPDTERLTAQAALRHSWMAGAGPETRSAEAPLVAGALRRFTRLPLFKRVCLSSMAWALPSNHHADLRELFLEMDRGQKGVVTIGDVRAFMAETIDGAEAVDLEALSVFRGRCGGDEEDESQEIQYSEFLAAMVSTRIAIDDDVLCDTFRRFDGDGHMGVISLESLRQVVGDSVEGQQVHKLLSDHITYPDFVSYMCEGAPLVSCREGYSLPVIPALVAPKDARSCCTAGSTVQGSCAVQ